MNRLWTQRPRRGITRSHRGFVHDSALGQETQVDRKRPKNGQTVSHRSIRLGSRNFLTQSPRLGSRPALLFYGLGRARGTQTRSR